MFGNVQAKEECRIKREESNLFNAINHDSKNKLNSFARQPGSARSKETVYYDFTRANSDLLLDIIHAFGIASQQHNEDIRQILETILATAGN
jgi:hypothetical protein